MRHCKSFCFLLLTSCILFVSVQGVYAQETVTIQPKKPHPGETVTITYHPSSPDAVLTNPYVIKLIFNFPPNGDKKLNGITMKKTDKGWRAQKKLSKNFKYGTFYFKSNKKIDKNKDSHLYQIFAYKNGVPVKRAYLIAGRMVDKRYKNMDKIAKHILKVHLFSKEIKNHPKTFIAGFKLYKAKQELMRLYKKFGHLRKAYEISRNMLLKAPFYKKNRKLFKEHYIAYKGSRQGLKAAIKSVENEWRRQKTTVFKNNMLDKASPSLSSITNLQGQPIDLSTLENKVVVIDFWATWCGPCMASMPYMQKAYEEFNDNKNVRFIILNSGWNNKIQDAVKWTRHGEYAKNNYTFPVYFDKNSKLITALGFKGIPARVVLGQDGNIKFIENGFHGSSMAHKLTLKIKILLNKEL